jgi:hypothetical protein
MAIDGKSNRRYLVMNMTHDSYAAKIAHYTKLHTDKQAGNKLTVLPNIAGTQSIVKVVARPGWVDDDLFDELQVLPLTKGVDEASRLYINVYTYDDLAEVHALLASSDWPQAEIE